ALSAHLGHSFFLPVIRVNAAEPSVYPSESTIIAQSPNPVTTHGSQYKMLSQFQDKIYIDYKSLLLLNNK
ncbi:MAG: hypothetical protein ACRDCT_18740, partial [Shewanella sp.]